MIAVKSGKRDNQEDRHMFASNLFRKVEADYISLKIIYLQEPVYLLSTILTKQVELLEKSFKFYLAIHSTKVIGIRDIVDLGHNLEALREKCETYDVIFKSNTLKDITKCLNDKSGKFYQHLRYGSFRDIKGWTADIESIMKTIDEIYFYIIQNFDPLWVQVFTTHSLLKSIATQSKVTWKNKGLLRKAISNKNPHFKKYQLYCRKLDREIKILNQNIKDKFPCPLTVPSLK